MYFQVSQIIADILQRPIQPVGITFDSREVKEKTIFFALKGKNNDGRNFAQAALEMGGYVVSDTLDAPVEFLKVEHPNLIIVPNVEQVISEIIHKICESRFIIGVTGTSGKTFTKNAIGLSMTDYPVLVAPKNYNTPYGILLTLAELKQETEYIILELGISQLGDMELMGRIIRPSLSMILPIGVAHVANFESRDSLIQEKLTLLKYTRSKAVVHASLKQYIQNTNLELNYYSNDSVKIESNTHLKGSIISNNFTYFIDNPSLHGEHLLENMAGITILLQNLVKPERLITAFNNLKPQTGRNTIHDLISPNKIPFKLYDSSYNANAGMTGSMVRELNTIRNFPGDKILILGGMAQNGSESQKYHLEVLNHAEAISKKIILIGGDYSTEKYPHFIHLDIPQIIKILLENLTHGCIVFVKGSRVIGLEMLVNELKRRFSCY